VTTALDKRLDEIERMLAGIERDVADHRRDPFEMTDAECVEAVHKLCHLHPPGGRGQSRTLRKKLRSWPRGGS
jgi:hypothetical protein